MNFKTFEAYLRELERGQTDGQTDRQTNRMHKHFSTLLESVKKRNLNTLVMKDKSEAFMKKLEFLINRIN